MKKLNLLLLVAALCLVLSGCDSGTATDPTPVATSTNAPAAPSSTGPASTVEPTEQAVITQTPDLTPGAAGTPVVIDSGPNEMAGGVDVSPNETSVPDDANTAFKPNTGTGFDFPKEGERVTFPIHVQARVGRLNEEVVLKIKWQDGQEYSEKYNVLFDNEGNGVLVDSLDWTGESAPPDWPSQPATLQVLSPGGSVLASRGVSYLAMNDPDVMYLNVFWVVPEQDELHARPRSIARTRQVGTAAINELLWGIGPRNFAGFDTAIPTPDEVLTYPGRQTNWGARVRLRKLTIVEGIATVDFTKEMAAYGGGSARVKAITDQVTLTLKQFPSVQEVRILVDGKASALQP